MKRIDPIRHPVLHRLSQGAQWIGQDDYPAWPEWADEHERWLQFIDGKGQMGRYLSRLRGPKEQRDETLSEIGPAYFLERRCGLPIIQWEPVGVGGRKGEYLVGIPGGSMFTEVKSPGWEADVVQAEGRNSARLSKPKYINAEARSIAPWALVRAAVDKAYPKMPDQMPTLLIINDDYWVHLSEQREAVDIALYCPRGLGHHPHGYLAEDGCFVGRRFERLGGVGIFNVILSGRASSYRFALFLNPNAIPTVAVPRTTFGGYPAYDGTQR